MVQQEELSRQGRQDLADGRDDSSCDESKCISYGLSTMFNVSFTCYADDDFFPMRCADGYQPRVVDSVSPVSQNDIIFNRGNSMGEWMEPSPILFHYHTCCPPDLPLKTEASRQCSDPVVQLADNTNNISTIACEDDVYPHPRQMKHSSGTKAYMCCDSIINNKTQTNFLNDTECVPYVDDHYNTLIFTNDYGVIVTTECNLTDFPFAKYKEAKNNRYNDQFECCKTGPGQPFVQDSVFKQTIYPQIAVSSIAVLFSVVLILALLIPFCSQLKEQTKERAQTRRHTPQDVYSTYNLYLVYLAFPDLILNVYLLGMYGSYANQKFNPKFYGNVIESIIFVDGESREAWNGSSPSEVFEGTLIVGCSAANLYLNAVIAFEVLTLLKRCNQIMPHNPPSVTKVHWQVGVTYVVAIIISIFGYFMTQTAIKALAEAHEDEIAVDCGCKAGIVYWASFSLHLLLALLIPVGYLCYVCTVIWCQHLMPSATGRMKELAWFFFRIILVFILTWIPGLTLVIYGSSAWSTSNLPMYANIGYIFCALQSILSTVLAMTKSDVRKYVANLLTLSYCCRMPARQEHEDKSAKQEHEEAVGIEIEECQCNKREQKE